jgi:hypothetical protein
VVIFFHAAALSISSLGVVSTTPSYHSLIIETKSS